LDDDAYVDPLLPDAVDRFNSYYQLLNPPQLHELEESWPEPLDLASLSVVAAKQESLSARADACLWHLALEQAHSNEDLARLQSLRLPWAMQAYNLSPNKYNGTYMENRLCKAHLQFVLGAFNEHVGHQCVSCNSDLDRLGNHAATCHKGINRKRKHDALVQIIAETAREAGIPVRLDQALLQDLRNAPRPADLYFPNWQGGCEAVADVTVRSPLVPQLVQRAVQNATVPLRRAEEEKRAKYGAQCDERGALFVPLAVTTYGGWSTTAVNFFERLVGAKADELSKPHGQVRHAFYSRLAVALARCTANAILDRRPPLPVPPSQ